MSEYIEREALMKNFCGYDLTKCVKYGNENAEQQHDSYSTMMMYEIADEIEDAPSADVVPVRHGRWEWCKDYDGDSILVCSECGRVCHEEDAPYCYCGAKMDGGFDNG